MDNQSSNNPFANGASEAVPCQKSGLLLDLGADNDGPGDSFKQNGKKSPDLFFLQRPSNGKVTEDDDLGPETDVDAVDDVQISPCNNNPFGADLEHQRQQLLDFDPIKEPRQETPTPPADEVPGVAGLVPDNVAESGEDSDDEWNYYSVEPSGNTVAETESLQQSNQPVSQKPASLQGILVPSDSAENMESQLNPNAAEFIPSPTQTRPSMEELLQSEAKAGGDAELQHEESSMPDNVSSKVTNVDCLSPISPGAKLPDLLNGQQSEGTSNDMDQCTKQNHINGGTDDPVITNSDICDVPGQESKGVNPFDSIAQEIHGTPGHEKYSFADIPDDDSNMSDFRGFTDDSNISGFRGFVNEDVDQSFPGVESNLSNLRGIVNEDSNNSLLSHSAEESEFHGFTEEEVAASIRLAEFRGFTEEEVAASIRLAEARKAVQEPGDESRTSFMFAELDLDNFSTNGGISETPTSHAEQVYIGTETTSSTVTESNQFTAQEMSSETCVFARDAGSTFQAGDINMRDVVKEPIHISFELQKDLAPEMESQPERVKVNGDDRSTSFEVQEPLLEDTNHDLEETSSVASVDIENVKNDELHDAALTSMNDETLRENLQQCNEVKSKVGDQSDVQLSEVKSSRKEDYSLNMDDLLPLQNNELCSPVQDTSSEQMYLLNDDHDAGPVLSSIVEPKSSVPDFPLEMSKSPLFEGKALSPNHPLHICVYPLGDDTTKREPEIPVHDLEDLKNVELLGLDPPEIDKYTQVSVTHNDNLLVSENPLQCISTLETEIHENIVNTEEIKVSPQSIELTENNSLLLEAISSKCEVESSEEPVPVVTQMPPPTLALTVDVLELESETQKLIEAEDSQSEIGEKAGSMDGQAATTAATVAATVATAIAASIQLTEARNAVQEPGDESRTSFMIAELDLDKFSTNAGRMSEKKAEECAPETKKNAAVSQTKKPGTAVIKKRSLPEKAKAPSKVAVSSKPVGNKAITSVPTSPTKAVASSGFQRSIPKKSPVSAPSSRLPKIPATTTATTGASRPKPSGIAPKTASSTSRPRPSSGTASTTDKQIPTKSEISKPVPKRPEPLVAKKLETTTKVPSRPVTAPAATLKVSAPKLTRTAASTLTSRPNIVSANGPSSKPKIPSSTVSRVKLPMQPKVTNAKEGKETVNKQISSSRTETKTTSVSTVNRNIATTTTRKVDSRVTGNAKLSVSKTATTTVKTSGKIAVKKTCPSTATSGSSSTKTKSPAPTENRDLVTVQEINSTVITTNNEVKCDQGLFENAEHTE